MTQTAPVHDHPAPETFFGILLRRSRYAVAVACSAFLFSTLAWQFAAPPASYGGVSLLFWGTGPGIIAALLILLLLAAVAALCTFLVHPDNPHMGLFCAILGMTGLSIRGGSIYPIIRLAQESPEAYRAAARTLAMECLIWGAVCIAVSLLISLFYKKFFHNHHWVFRSGGEVSPESLRNARPGETVMGVAKNAAAQHTTKMPPSLAAPLALVLCGIISFAALFLLLQSQSKGQVVVACFGAFYLAGVLTYLVFPRAPILAFIAAVPLTAAIGYFYAAGQETWPLNRPGFFPGQAHFFMMRALPIDYLATGIPGIVLGYYHGFWWSLHSHEE